ncbi:MAG: arylamine N-acetyltransferase [Anaerolineales bacterium]|nr:arylamine N-acetyltransferase [Anaerolineales bacterium]
MDQTAVDAYLQRIACPRPIRPDAAALRQLHLAHLLAVPFENLSIHLDELILLEPELLLAKIVTRRRGGFCFELNGLLAELLLALGFRVRRLAAEVFGGDSYSPPFDHMMLLVDLAEPWLVDVGFGASFREPLRLVPDVVQQDPEGAFRLVETAGRWVMQEAVDGAWQPQCRFTTTGYELADFNGRCQFHQESPNSHFRQSRMATLATPTGRITLSGRRFITTNLNGERQEELLPSEAACQQKLAAAFGLTLESNATQS